MAIELLLHPLASAVPFISILLAGALTLMAAPAMEAPKRKYAWAAVALAALGTLVAFLLYTLNNVAQPTWSLVVNVAAATAIILGVLALLVLAGFRAK